ADPGSNKPFCTVEGRNEVPEALDAQIVRDAAAFLARGEKMQLTYTVANTSRAIGARVSSHIVHRFGMDGLAPGHLTVQLKGSAGQSLGAFAVQGLRLELTGEANDYVGKGLSGATIVIRPAPEVRRPELNAVLGNTVLYGATAGRLASTHWEGVLRGLVEEHARETGSPVAEALLRDWERERGRFWQVCPKEMLGRLDHALDAEEAVHLRA